MITKEEILEKVEDGMMLFENPDYDTAILGVSEKQVYIQKTRVEIFLKDGTKINTTPYYYGGSQYYSYGCLPNDEQYEYGFDKFTKVFSLLIDKTLFRKREYVNYSWIGKRIYKENFDKAVITIEYKVVDEPRIDWLQKLGFNLYSELVFNRENELRKLLVK